MKKVSYHIAVAIVFLTLATSSLLAQQPPTPLTPQEQKTVVDSIGSKLNANYIFPDIAKQMVTSIESKLGNGEYTSIKDPQQFANTLTEDLQSVSKDKHIRVTFAPDQIAEQQQVGTP